MDIIRGGGVAAAKAQANVLGTSSRRSATKLPENVGCHGRHMMLLLLISLTLPELYDATGVFFFFTSLSGREHER